MYSARALLAAGVGLALSVAPVRSQVTIIDEGSFTLSVGGERVGREDFSIRSTRSGAGLAYVAQGTVLRGEVRLTVVLNFDSTGSPLRLQTERRDGPDLRESYFGRRERGIWSGRAVREGGESARELLFPSDALAVDSEIMHHLWLVMRFGRDRETLVIGPRTLSQRRTRVEEVGAERVALGLRELPARHWAVRDQAGGALLWEVWTDTAGRLLRVLDPRTSIEAIRDEPPA
jgi:hypothetical protein